MTHAYNCYACGAKSAEYQVICAHCWREKTFVPIVEVESYESEEVWMTVDQARASKRSSLVLPPPWEQLFSKIPAQAGWIGMVWGPPMHGKTSMLIEFITDLGEGIFVSLEEEVTAGVAEKISKRSKSGTEVLLTDVRDVYRVTEKARSIGTDWIIWDSLQKLQLQPAEITNLRRDGFKCIFSLQATKDGKDFKGVNEIAHEVDFSCCVRDLTATVEKNRWYLEGSPNGRLGHVFDFRLFWDTELRDRSIPPIHGEVPGTLSDLD